MKYSLILPLTQGLFWLRPSHQWDLLPWKHSTRVRRKTNTANIQKGSFLTLWMTRNESGLCFSLHGVQANYTVIRDGSQPLQRPHCLQWSRHWPGHVIITADRCKVAPHLHNNRKQRGQTVLTVDDFFHLHLQLSKGFFIRIRTILEGCLYQVQLLHRVCVEVTCTKPQKRHKIWQCQSLHNSKLGDQEENSSVFWWRRAPTFSLYVHPMGKR